MTDFKLVSPKVKRAFPLGKIVMTTEALRKIHLGDMSDGLNRHAQGDWGDVNKEDCDENQVCLDEGYPLHSVYHDRNGVKFCIITDGERKATTVLLPKMINA